MKPALSFLVGALAGIIGLLFFQQPRTSFIQQHPTPSKSGAPSSASDLPLSAERASRRFSYGQPPTRDGAGRLSPCSRIQHEIHLSKHLESDFQIPGGSWRLKSIAECRTRTTSRTSGDDKLHAPPRTRSMKCCSDRTSTVWPASSWANPMAASRAIHWFS